MEDKVKKRYYYYMDVRKPASMQLAGPQCGGMRQLRAYTSEYQTKPALPRVAVLL